MAKRGEAGNRDTEMQRRRTELPKAITGIGGLDEILNGGLPKGRPTLVCGGPGCGKTLLGLQFLFNGATKFNEPGVLVLFEETSKEIVKNTASLGYDLGQLETKGLLVIDHITIEPREIVETGEYDLEGLFIRLGNAIDSIGAKRVVLDTIESLFSGIPNESIVRAELRRLFRWLREREVTTIVTGESGEKTLTRQGLEEYVSDCVIILDHRVNGQISTRRLRVAKYRGSAHGTNEYPFIIGDEGISVLPITSIGLNYPVSNERISTGIEDLDQMFGGMGYYRGSAILVSGDSGTGKTSFAMAFASAACKRGEKALYIATEESPNQLMRNMRSIGIEIGPYIKKGLLRFYATRATTQGLETHLAIMHRMIDAFEPNVLIIDPLTSFTAIGSDLDSKAMLARIIDYSKAKNITTILTDLQKPGQSNRPDETVTSLLDTWISLQRLEINGEHNRGLFVFKSRGMDHSNQIREFVMTDHGISLIFPYIGSGRVLTGTARYIQEAKDSAEGTQNDLEMEGLRQERERQRDEMKTQLANVQSKFKTKEAELNKQLAILQSRAKEILINEAEMKRTRGASHARKDGQKVKKVKNG